MLWPNPFHFPRSPLVAMFTYQIDNRVAKTSYVRRTFYRDEEFCGKLSAPIENKTNDCLPLQKRIPRIVWQFISRKPNSERAER